MVVAADLAEGRPRLRLLQRQTVYLLHLLLYFPHLAVNPHPSIRIFLHRAGGVVDHRLVLHGRHA